MNTKKSPSRASSAVRNDYRCSMEKNQSGKYCVRIQVFYPRHAWNLGVYFLASSFDRAMKKLEESLDFLQRHEEKLWFWGVDRAEDMGFSAEFLREAGMKLDQRTEFPEERPIFRWLRSVKCRRLCWGRYDAGWPNRWRPLVASLLATDLRSSIALDGPQQTIT